MSKQARVSVKMSLPSNVISQRVITTRVVHFNFLPVCCRMSSSAVRKSPLINWDSSAYLPAFVTLTNNRNSTRATLAPWNNDVPLTNHRRSPQVMLTPRNNEVPEMVKRMMAFPPPPFFFCKGRSIRGLICAKWGKKYHFRFSHNACHGKKARSDGGCR